MGKDLGAIIAYGWILGQEGPDTLFSKETFDKKNNDWRAMSYKSFTDNRVSVILFGDQYHGFPSSAIAIAESVHTDVNFSESLITKSKNGWETRLRMCLFELGFTKNVYEPGWLLLPVMS